MAFITAYSTFSGQTVLAAVKALRSAGAEVRSTITHVDPQIGARDFLAHNEIQRIPLIEVKDITLPGKQPK